MKMSRLLLVPGFVMANEDKNDNENDAGNDQVSSYVHKKRSQHEENALYEELEANKAVRNYSVTVMVT